MNGRGALTCFSIAVTSLLLGAVATRAQEAKPAEGGSGPSDAAVATAPPAPFDVGARTLPPGYEGADIVALFAALADKAPLKKGEFEATADWEKRVASAVTDEVLAFRFQPSTSLYGLLISYDADAQAFKVWLQTEYTDAGKVYRPCVLLKKTGEQEGSYVGRNAFGAEMRVTTRKATQYGIAPVNYKALGSSTHYSMSHKKPASSAGKLTIDLPAAADRAKALKDNLAVLLVCKLALYTDDRSPFRSGNDLLRTDFDFRTPTVNAPFDYAFERKLVNAEVLAVWLYDRASGEILMKKPLK